jgi:ABC-type multidrug transport system permease subunit
MASYATTGTYLFISIVVLLVYGYLNHDTQSIQSRTGVLFLTLLIYVFNPVQKVILLFPDERPVFLREQGSSIYSPTVYFIAKMITELPIMLFDCTLAALLGKNQHI